MYVKGKRYTPIHVQLVLISRLNGPCLGEALHNLDGTVELRINELAGVHVHLARMRKLREL